MINGAFAGFFVKEVRHILRDRRTLLILFGMPLAQLLLFGFALRNDITGADIALLDRAGSAQSARLAASLEAGGRFRITTRPLDDAGLERALRSGAARAALVVEEQHGRLSYLIVTDASDPNTAQVLAGYLRALAAAYAGVPDPPVTFETRLLYNPAMESTYGFVPGLFGIILILISALMTSITLTREKELGSMEMLLVSPLHPVTIITGKVAPYFILSFVNVLTILVLAVSVFDVPFRGSTVLFGAVSMLYVLVALGLGIFISGRVPDQQTAMMISLGALLLPVIMLSGFIFPIENMPVPLRAISHVIPARWYLVCARGIMLKGIGLESLWKEIAILAVMAAAFIGLSIRTFNIRLERTA